jgi:hypothetical protein
MNLAMIFAMLLQSGICAQSEFHDASGRTLQVMVCPRMSQAGGDVIPKGPPSADEAPVPEMPEAPKPPGSNT